MATFGLREQDSSESSVDRPINGHGPSTPLLSTESNFSVVRDDDEVEPTQAQSQQLQTFYNVNENEDLVAVLTFMGPISRRFELRKDQPEGKWSVGRGKKCTFVINDNQISNQHCVFSWNGRSGQQSEITLEDTSTNGTNVDNLYLKRGKTILRSGASICLANIQDLKFIFQDIEGYSNREASHVWAKYDIGAELGRGAFAKVNKCVERTTGKAYAVKIIDKIRLRSAGKAIAREIRILEGLSQYRHENIVELHEYFDENDSLYLVLEWLPGGDLYNYIVKNGPIPEAKVRPMAAQMCQAVAYIHQKDVAHRDLKPENILLTLGDPPKCKIGDFGLAKIVSDQTFLKTTCGTPAYLAPEVALRQDNTQAYDNKVDSWSLGIIFFCMLTSASPFMETYNQAGPEHERKNYFSSRVLRWDLLDKIPLSVAGHSFLRSLLKFDPDSRLSVERMLDHEWISDFVPSYSKMFPFPNESLPTPSPTDQDTLACSQSFQHLNLSDGLTMPIPGLTAASPDSVEPTPPPIDVEVPSFTSDASTIKMPGAFPRGRRPPATFLPAIAEGDSNTLLGNTESTETLRRKNLIAGSSPLSSLTSDDDSDSSEQPNIPSRPQRPDSKRKRANDSPPPDANPRKARRPASRGRKRATSNAAPIRKSTRTRSTRKL